VTEIFNLRDDPVAGQESTRAGHRFTRTMIGAAVGATLTGLSVYELPPGQAGWAYHYELHREEWLIVVAGEVVVRTPAGSERVRCAGALRDALLVRAGGIRGDPP
jgi:uncharacterized cupin superfamily protein